MAKLRDDERAPGEVLLEAADLMHPHPAAELVAKIAPDHVVIDREHYDRIKKSIQRIKGGN